MKAFVDLTGQRFGSLTVIEYSHRRTAGSCCNRHWICQCDCGNYLIVRQDNLKDGRSSRCSDCRSGGVPSVFVKKVMEI